VLNLFYFKITRFVEEGKNMRKLFILIMIVAAIAIFTGFQNRGGANQKCNCQFVEESLEDISKIKVGMTRKDLLKSFGEEGGISTKTQKHYVYNKCMFIKIEVKFASDGNAQNKSVESPDDKIIEISKPYLEYVIAD